VATVRVAKPVDASACRALYAPYVSDTAVSFEVDPPSVAEMRDRVRETLEEHPWLVCEHRGRVVGYANAHPYRGGGAYRWSVESSVYVDEAARRRGVARGLYGSLFAVLALQGFVNAYAVTSLPNPASVGLHRATGFAPVGDAEAVGYKRGEWHDLGWWHRRLRPLPDDPDPPTPLPDLRGTTALAEAVSAGERHLRLCA
jgi:phosphinothricin acetyltransferase